MTSSPFHWSELPSVPDAEGFASPFAGVAGGTLLVAGGANFRDGRPWSGGTKVWYDRVFALADPSAMWSEAGRLARPTAYGLSVTAQEGVICVGGGDARENFSTATLLRWTAGRLEQESLPKLPRPCAFMSGALVRRTLFVLGGIERPTDTAAMPTCWSLDLDALGRGWQEEPPCPGPARMLAVAGAVEETLVVVSGVSLRADAQGRPARTYLSDSYAYQSGKGWRRLADVPKPVVAAPSPAPVDARGRVLVVGGDDGTRRHLDGPQHPGFPRDIQAYALASDTWTTVGEAPFSRATVPTAPWNGRWIIPNGERIPGFRSPEVWALECRT